MNPIPRRRARILWTLALAGTAATRPARAQSKPRPPAPNDALGALDFRPRRFDFLAYALQLDESAAAPATVHSSVHLLQIPTRTPARLMPVAGAPANIAAPAPTTPAVTENRPGITEIAAALAENLPAVTETAPATATTAPATAAPVPVNPPNVPGAPITPPVGATSETPKPPAPEPILAPQVPAPAAPPRDLPITSPPSTPVTGIENPNVILAPPPLAGVQITPGATTPTAPGGGPVGSAAGLQIPPTTTTPPTATATTPATPQTPATPSTPAPISPDVTQIPSSPATDIASGQEDPNGQFSLEAPGGVIFDRKRGLALAQGQVTFRYRDLTVTGDRGVIDYNVNRATLAGNLQVSARGQSFQGQSLTFDLDTGRWLLSSVAKTFPPELFPPGTVLSPLYIRNGTVIGAGDSATGQNFRFSSCDRDDYYLLSKRIDFYRDKNGQPQRLVARKNFLYVLGQRILPLPVYVIALVAGAGATRTPIQSTFGQNATDGYFVKSFYDLRATNRETQSLLVDLLSKRGLGLGLQRAAAGGGLLYLYGLSSKTGGREINFTGRQNNSLGNNIRSSYNLAGTQNNSLTGPGIAAQNGDLTLIRNGKNAQTNLVLRANRSSFGTGGNTSGAISLDQRQNFGRGFSLTASGQLNRSVSSFGAAGTAPTSNTAQTADANLQLGKTSKAFDIFLRGELHPDLQNHRIVQLQRLPELTLQSGTDRMNLPVLSKYLKGNFTLGLGRFQEPRGFSSTATQTVQSVQKDRADLFYTFRERQARLFGQGRSQSVFRANGNFEQAFYSDTSARYNYAYNTNITNTLGNLTLQANYYNARTFGSTPFQFDFFNPSENLDYTASYNLGQKLRLNLTGGQDILNNYKRDLIFNAQFAPSRNFYGSLGTSYALQNSNFGDIYGNFNLARNRAKFGGGTLAFGFRYNPNGRGLTQANASADVNLGKSTRVQGLTSYNGFSKKFDFTQIRVIQDLHCFNLYVNYDNQRHQLRFDLALKAFPFADTRFGRNVFSEGFDSSVGINR